MPVTVRLLALLVMLGAQPALAADGDHRAKSTTKEAARTGGHAARDGVQTFGRSVRAFFTGGPSAAKQAWKSNAAHTKADAKAGAHATKHAAHGG